MDKISHCVTCLKIETYMSGKNAETFSLIRFGVFTESLKRFFKSPKLLETLPESCGRWRQIMRSLELNRAVVEAGSCGRWGRIVRSILRVGIFDYFCKDNRNLNHAATGHKELFSSCKLTYENTGPDYNKTGVCI